jgi:elongation factor G
LLIMKGISWNEADKGMTYEVFDIPADMVDEAKEWRDKLIESVAESDEKLMEKFFENPDSITREEIMAAVRVATINMTVQPVLCGSAFKNKGVQTMLDAVMAYLPSPYDKGAVEGMNPDTEEMVKRNANPDEPMAALAFKIATDPFVGRLCFFRMYSGKVDAGSYVYNMRTGNKERISRLFQMHANKQNPIEFVEAGDIAAGVGFKDIRTGDTLCDEKNQIVLESMDFN